MLLWGGVAVGVVVAVGGRVLDHVRADLGHIDWSDGRAEAATAATARYMGAAYEHARRLGAGAVTTRERQRCERIAVVAERERRLLAMTAQAEPAPLRLAG